MNAAALKQLWLHEEEIAHIQGWDFSHIQGRYQEEGDLPWDYAQIIRQYLRADMRLLDYDTGGGEFLLSLNHPPVLTAATEGYAPNVDLCKKHLLPLQIDFRPCEDPAHLPFEDAAFDMVINRHGDLNAAEFYRILKPKGLFITQQVGAYNDRDLVLRVLPDTPLPFPQQTLDSQVRTFRKAGFTVLQADEAYRPIVFYDIGAFVWFAHIIEWEFPGFSVDKCFDRLLSMQAEIEQKGYVRGTIHRFLIVAQK